MLKTISGIAAVHVALALWTSATPAAAQTPPTTALPSACQEVLFGRLCMASGAEPSLVGGRDYGYVEIGVIPPANAAVTSANRRTWESLLRQYFAPRARTGQVVVKVYLEDGPQRTLLATVPIALFDIDQRNGAKRVANGTFSNIPIRVTPYIRLTSQRALISYDVEIRSSDQTSSMIVERVRQGIDIAAGISGVGGLPTAVATAATAQRLQTIEQSLVALANVSGDSTIKSYLDLNNQPSATYEFGFVPNGERTGRITLRYRRAPSLFTAEASDGQPVYGLTSVAGRSEILSQMLGAQSVDALLQGRLNTTGWAALAAPNTPEAAWASHCNALVDEASLRLGLSQPDATAVIWAALNRGDMGRPEIRDLPCARDQEAAFAALRLPMPAVRQSDGPGGGGGAGGGGGGGGAVPPLKPVTAPNFSRNEMRDFLGGLFGAMAMEADAPGKAALLERHFANRVTVSEAFDIDTDFPSVAATEEASALARVLGGFAFTSSCYARDAEGRITFFGRRRDPGPMVRSLWVFTLTPGAPGDDATSSNVRIIDLRVREAREADFVAARTSNPGQADCHSAPVVP